MFTSLGAGEILLQSIDNDGTLKGFDRSILESVKKELNCPITVLGGASSYENIKEISKCKKLIKSDHCFAKRFAAKEALSKALGVGLYRKGIYPKYISVKHDDFGKPFLSLSSELETIINNHNMKIQLSITDSDTQSIAFVVIES